MCKSISALIPALLLHFCCPIPERKLLEHEQGGDITDRSSTFTFKAVLVSFEWSCCMQAKPIISSEDAISGAWEQKAKLSDTCLDWIQGWEGSSGCAGKSSRNLEQFGGRTCCGRQGQGGFWVSTKVASTDREKTKKCLAFLVKKWKQVKNESGARTAWWGTLPWPSSASAEFYQLNQGTAKLIN